MYLNAILKNKLIFHRVLQVRCTASGDILKLCDKYTPGPVKEYYFDR